MISKDLNKLHKLNSVSSDITINTSISTPTKLNNVKSTLISNPISIKQNRINNVQISISLPEDSHILFNNNDAINKKYETCGCILISELDILENIIHDKHIQLCKQHYKKHIEKSSYYYNKKLNKYIYNQNKSSNSTNISNNKNINSINVNISKSYENLQGLLYNNLTKKSDSNLNIIKNSEYQTLVNFGKYKDKSYEYVYYNDKLYCYNLAFWNIKEFKNKKIINFINFIKQQLLLESI
jgi:hypothetical protein